MFRGGIRIVDTPARLGVRFAPLRITYPRGGRLVLSVLALAGGLALWLGDWPAGAWDPVMEWALGLILVAPGAWGLVRALRPRPVVAASGGDLVVRHGPAFFERTVARLPLETLDVRVAEERISGKRLDVDARTKLPLAALSPLARSRLADAEVSRYVLQVRSAGQAEWLSVFGSQLASEMENARLAVVAAAGEAVEVEAEEADEPGESGGGVNRSPENC